MKTWQSRILRWKPTHRDTFLPSLSSRMTTKHTPQPTYEYVEGVENLYDYDAGGFHPVNIGDYYHYDRYRVVHKLGHGAGSTVWLARDVQLMKYVALKVGLANWETNEAAILTALMKGKEKTNSLFTSLLDHFSFNGPNGKHNCLVLEAARCSLLDCKQNSPIELFPLQTARVLAAQIILAVCIMHSKGYIHNDLHLGNILLKLPYNSLAASSDEQLYSELGRPIPQAVIRRDKAPLSCHVPSKVYEAAGWLGVPTESVAIQDAKILLSGFSDASEPMASTECNTPIHLRPPETYFEPDSPLTPASDIWCLALLLWDILSQRPLFGEILASYDDIINQQINTLGMLPGEWWDKWEARSRFFERDGTPIESYRSLSWNESFEQDIQEPRREGNLGGALDAPEEKALASMLISMLRYQPADRPTVQEILKSEWMTKYAFAELKNAAMATDTC